MRALSRNGNLTTINQSNNKIYLGNIHGSHIHDGYAGAVFDIRGLAPALTTCQGGGREPHIVVYDGEQRKKNW